AVRDNATGTNWSSGTKTELLSRLPPIKKRPEQPEFPANELLQEEEPSELRALARLPTDCELIEAPRLTLATANGPPTARVPPTFRFSVTFKLVSVGSDEWKVKKPE